MSFVSLHRMSKGLATRTLLTLGTKTDILHDGREVMNSVHID